MSTILVKYGRYIKQSNKGFSLLELAIVLMIISLLFVFILPTSTVILNNHKREQTQLKLKNIESALANYVAINKRLPCPADGSVLPGAVGAGTEGARNASGDCTNNQISGVVPWVNIGLTQADIEDGWNRRVTYRAGFSLTRDGALDMSWCDPAGSRTADITATVAPYGKCYTTCVGNDMTTCTSPQKYLAGKGFDIRDGSGSNLIMSNASFMGAAYVIISHGENGYGAYNNNGDYLASASVGVAGVIEAFNINGPGVTVTNALPTSANTFRDAEFSEGVAAVYFDDRMIRPSIFSLIQRAQTGPRSH
jgi:prepilin-type N-terminal cleavage/methylation domain-containing protein